MCSIPNPSPSDVDDSGQLLHPIEEDVPLFYAGLILSVLAIRPVCHYNSSNLVNLGV